jgi:hypothetical protein
VVLPVLGTSGLAGAGAGAAASGLAAAAGSAWFLDCPAQPARTERTATARAVEEVLKITK